MFFAGNLCNLWVSQVAHGESLQVVGITGKAGGHSNGRLVTKKFLSSHQTGQSPIFQAKCTDRRAGRG